MAAVVTLENVSVRYLSAAERPARSPEEIRRRRHRRRHLL